MPNGNLQTHLYVDIYIHKPVYIYPKQEAHDMEMLGFFKKRTPILKSLISKVRKIGSWGEE